MELNTKQLIKLLDDINAKNGYDFDYNEVNKIPTNTKGKLFLTNRGGLYDYEKYDIKTVFSMCKVSKPINVEKHVIMQIEDHEDPINKERMEKILDSVTKEIHECLENGKNVLVHCLGGVSRSSTLVAGYLIKYQNLTVEESLILIKNIRKCVYPNETFLEILLKLKNQ